MNGKDYVHFTSIYCKFAHIALKYINYALIHMDGKDCVHFTSICCKFAQSAWKHINYIILTKNVDTREPIKLCPEYSFNSNIHTHIHTHKNNFYHLDPPLWLASEIQMSPYPCWRHRQLGWWSLDSGCIPYTGPGSASRCPPAGLRRELWSFLEGQPGSDLPLSGKIFSDWLALDIFPE